MVDQIADEKHSKKATFRPRFGLMVARGRKVAHLISWAMNCFCYLRNPGINLGNRLSQNNGFKLCSTVKSIRGAETGGMGYISPQ